MDNYEEYLLRVFRRTHAGLQDSLIPVHANKLTKLLEKFESSPLLEQEIQILENVNGFFKCACAMEWLVSRTKRAEEEFSPEQFESDILFLNEKLFEAFLNQPFDMPDYSTQAPAAVPPRAIQKDLHISDDEFLYIGDMRQTVPPDIIQLPEQETIGTEKSQKDKEFDEIFSRSMNEPFEPVYSPSEAYQTPQSIQSNVSGNQSPALAEAMNVELFELLQNVAAQGQDFFVKKQTERVVGAAVMRVSVKNALEVSRNFNNVIIQDFFQNLVTLINFADKEGKVKSDAFAESIRDVGDQLHNALIETSNGVNLLKNLTEYISNPKDLLSKG
jgi:hypothetical protein